MLVTVAEIKKRKETSQAFSDFLCLYLHLFAGRAAE